MPAGGRGHAGAQPPQLPAGDAGAMIGLGLPAALDPRRAARAGRQDQPQRRRPLGRPGGEMQPQPLATRPALPGEGGRAGEQQRGGDQPHRQLVLHQRHVDHRLGGVVEVAGRILGRADEAGRGRVDHDAPVSFTFDGKSYQGLRGDTVASALLANDVQLMGRSFKYHRPRGIFGCGAEEPNALVQIGEGNRTVPNLKATQVDLVEGLTARTINGWPNLRFDLYGISDRLSGLLPAGFYYKTFALFTKKRRRRSALIRKSSSITVLVVVPLGLRWAF